jgi:transposase
LQLGRQSGERTNSAKRNWQAAQPRYAGEFTIVPALRNPENYSKADAKRPPSHIPETGLVPLINEQGEKEKGRYEFSWCCSFSWGFGWRGTERSEPQRSVIRRCRSAALVWQLLLGPAERERPNRRPLWLSLQQRILAEAEAAAATRGGLGALLRREGLYSSLLTYWPRERADGILEALTPRKRGPKSQRDPLEEENQKLRRQNARLSEDLHKAHIIIDVQKKVAALLRHPIPEPDSDPEEKS